MLPVQLKTSTVIFRSFYVIDRWAKIIESVSSMVGNENNIKCFLFIVFGFVTFSSRYRDNIVNPFIPYLK